MVCVSGACGSLREGDSVGADGWRQRAGHHRLHRGVLCAAAAVHCGYVSPQTSLISQIAREFRSAEEKLLHY